MMISLLTKFANYHNTRLQKRLVWDLISPYQRQKSFTPYVILHIAGFYTGIIGAAINEQLYKEKYWEDHPGEAVPLMHPKFYWGPWKVWNGEVPPKAQSQTNPPA